MQRRKFSREFKIEAVKLVRQRGVSVAQAKPARCLKNRRWFPVGSVEIVVAVEGIGLHQTNVANKMALRMLSSPAAASRTAGCAGRNDGVDGSSASMKRPLNLLPWSGIFPSARRNNAVADETLVPGFRHPQPIRGRP